MRPRRGGAVTSGGGGADREHRGRARFHPVDRAGFGPLGSRPELGTDSARGDLDRYRFCTRRPGPNFHEAALARDCARLRGGGDSARCGTCSWAAICGSDSAAAGVPICVASRSKACLRSKACRSKACPRLQLCACWQSSTDIQSIVSDCSRRLVTVCPWCCLRQV
jgi:hypothetical protein